MSASASYVMTRQGYRRTIATHLTFQPSLRWVVLGARLLNRSGFHSSPRWFRTSSLVNHSQRPTNCRTQFITRSLQVAMGYHHLIHSSRFNPLQFPKRNPIWSTQLGVLITSNKTVSWLCWLMRTRLDFRVCLGPFDLRH